MNYMERINHIESKDSGGLDKLNLMNTQEVEKDFNDFCDYFSQVDQNMTSESAESLKSKEEIIHNFVLKLRTEIKNAIESGDYVKGSSFLDILDDLFIRSECSRNPLLREIVVSELTIASNDLYNNSNYLLSKKIVFLISNISKNNWSTEVFTLSPGSVGVIDQGAILVSNDQNKEVYEFKNDVEVLTKLKEKARLEDFFIFMILVSAM